MPRIDKVRLDNYYNSYPAKTSSVKREGEELQGASSVPEDKGVVYEPSSIEQSRQAEKAAPKAEKKTDLGAINAEESERTIPELLKEIGIRILSFVRGILSSIWNGPDSKQEAPAGESSEEPAGADVSTVQQTAEVPAENTLDRIIAEHDLDQLVRYVTENGEKKPARSTDLLTIYNRYGRLNTIDPSDRKKILEGNFNDIQL